MKLRFSLRAFFVLMAALACFLWYHISWIRQRHSILDSKELIIESIASSDVTAPGFLPFLGEEGKAILIVAHDVTNDELDEIRGYFPEAGTMMELHFDSDSP